MFKIARTRIVVFLVGVMFICFGLGTLITFASNGWSFDFSRYTVAANDTKVSDAAGIKEVIIDLSSAKLNIIPEEREDIKAVLSGSIFSTSEVIVPELTLSKSSGRINIGMKSQNTYWGPTNINLKVDIFLPKSYIESLTIDISSGDINLQEKMTLKNVSLSLSSGDITIKDLTCDKFEVETSSGSLKADSLSTLATKLQASSGDIDLKNFSGDIDGKVSSGEISVKYNTFNNNVNLQASSGSINLALPENAEFYIDANCSSGDIDCKFPVTTTGSQRENSLKGTVKSDTNKVVLNTLSGDINILK